MSVTVTKQSETEYSIFSDGKPIGSVETYESPFYSRNCYLKPNLSVCPVGFSAEIFNMLKNLIARPLQVMVYSDDLKLAEFLKAGGFELKRRCFESEVSAGDYIKSYSSEAHLSECAIGSEEYLKCCELLYQYHEITHREINPLTAEPEEFYKALPRNVIYEVRGGETTNFAFVEENEIAYLGSTDIGSFPSFLAGVVEKLFGSYKTLTFESDDCDPLAMMLRSLFKNNSDLSFDTYILE